MLLRYTACDTVLIMWIIIKVDYGLSGLKSALICECKNVCFSSSGLFPVKMSQRDLSLWHVSPFESRFVSFMMRRLPNVNQTQFPHGFVKSQMV